MLDSPEPLQVESRHHLLMVTLNRPQRRKESVRDELSFLPGLQVDCAVIVAVNGACAVVGLHSVADADIAIASDGASFLDPYVTVGRVSALEPSTLLLRARQTAVVRMALLGSSERLTASQALGAGLVSEVVPHDELC